MRCNGAGGMDHGRCPRPSSQRGTAGGAQPPGDAPVGRAERVGLRGGVCLPAATADPRGSSSIPEPSARVGESLETSYLDPRESELRDGGPSPFDDPPPTLAFSLSIERERDCLASLGARPRFWRFWPSPADGGPTAPRGAPTPTGRRRPGLSVGRARRNESNAEDAPGPAGRPPLLPSSSGAVFAESERRPAPRRSTATATGASLLSRVVPRREMRKLKRGPAVFVFCWLALAMRALRHSFQIVAKRGQNNFQRVFFCQLSAKRRKNEGSLLAKNREVWKPLPPKNLKAKQHSPHRRVIFLLSLSSLFVPPPF